MRKVIVAFQGEHGAYSEEAVYQHFPRDTETLPCHSLKEIFEAIESGRATHGMLPIENSTAGSINQSYDLLLEYDLKIWAEVILRVRHCLLANPGTTIEQIRRVRSHPQALAQCERYIASHNFEPVSFYDTAGSARELAENPQPDMAAIASRLAGEMYGLQVLDSDIEDLRFNYTRFFVLSTEDPPRTDHSKTSVVFATRHVPRALYTWENLPSGTSTSPSSNRAPGAISRGTICFTWISRDTGRNRAVKKPCWAFCATRPSSKCWARIPPRRCRRNPITATSEHLIKTK